MVTASDAKTCSDEFLLENAFKLFYKLIYNSHENATAKTFLGSVLPLSIGSTGVLTVLPTSTVP
jgi:hypothetical protein